MELGRLDRLLLWLAPQTALRRVQARSAVRQLTRHYDAADFGGRRTDGWNYPPTDANAAQYTGLIFLRQIARDLKRNNGWARRGISVIANNVVGRGIRPRIRAESQEEGERAAAIWRTWAHSPAACHYEERLPFYGLQRMAMEAIVESGEVIIRRFRGGDESELSLRVQVLEGDYLDVRRDGFIGESGGPVVQGVEFDKRGFRTAYWLYRQHPGSHRLPLTGYVSERVPAADVIHVYRVDRPQQVRGVSWLAAAIARLKDFDGYADAALLQQKVAACFAAFVTDIEGVSGPIGSQKSTDNPLTERLEPGMIQYVPPGKSITFAQPPANPNHTAFSQMYLRAIAAAIDVTYEDLTGDYSQVSFSSSRMARLAHWGSVANWQEHMFVPQFCDGIFAWVMDQAVALGMLPRQLRADWTYPHMPMIDPAQEGKALTDQVRGGFKTYPEALRELGKNPDEHIAEYAEAVTKLRELGVKLDSDPSQTTTSGGPVQPAAEAARVAA